MTRCAMCNSTGPIDHGLLCASCRAEDSRLVDDICQCVQCREGLTHIMPCEKEQPL